ncbi:VanZ family protein [Stygiobacter electus]|uniref:VanZ family protein n=1 Tax=Stygiobacter electus TaxID=3032292 RepID=A0AAE3TCV9_9BACT|nr:VanZ family protein [Stygiobacter electus]MDF1610563.1 VanZ family protein [Stygiobacter electus]
MQLNFLLIRLYNYLKQNKVLFVYLPLTIYWLIIFIATSLPTIELPNLFKLQDKLEHFLAYFILAIFILFTLHFQDKNLLLKKRLIISSIIILSFYAAIDELHQILIPGRVADFYDWSADVIGGLFGIIISNKIIKAGLSQLAESQ